MNLFIAIIIVLLVQKYQAFQATQVFSSENKKFFSAIFYSDDYILVSNQNYQSDPFYTVQISTKKYKSYDNSSYCQNAYLIDEYQLVIVGLNYAIRYVKMDGLSTTVENQIQSGEQNKQLIQVFILNSNEEVYAYSKDANKEIIWKRSGTEPQISLTGCDKQINGLFEYGPTIILALCEKKLMYWEKEVQQKLDKKDLDHDSINAQQFSMIFKQNKEKYKFILIIDKKINYCSVDINSKKVNYELSLEIKNIPKEANVLDENIFIIDLTNRQIIHYQIDVLKKTISELNIYQHQKNISKLQISPKGKNLVFIEDQQVVYNIIVKEPTQIVCQPGEMKKDNSCVKCAYFCATCSADINKCDSCIAGNTFRNDVSQNCSCWDSYYDNLNNPICLKCPYYCKLCQQQSGNQIACLSCKDSQESKRQQNTGDCSCLDGYYDDGKSENCVKCPDNCKSCKLILEKLQCSQCVDGYYQSTKAQLCQQCNQKCQTCISESFKCLSCYDSQNRELIGSDCVCKQDYSQLNSRELVCSLNKNCDRTCETCLQPNKEDSCLTCPSERELIIVGNQKFCKCRSGYYSSPEQQCFQCHSICKSCNGPTVHDCLNCLDIEQNKIFDTLTSSCKCKEGYFELNSQCQKCASSCKACSGGGFNQCTSCYDNQNKIIQNGQCICQDGFYLQSGQCLKCHISCKTCIGERDNQCKSCNEPKQLKGNQCLCEIGKSLVNNVCLPCDLSCKTCSDTNNLICELCDESQNRQLVKNKCICKEGFFESNTQLCEKCHENCKTCKGPESSQCTSCDLNANKIISNSQCVCQEGFFLSNYQCFQCDPSCKSCNEQGSNSCTSCDESLNKTLKENQCVCQNGYFKVKNECLDCHESCETCTNQNKNFCESCYESQNRYLINQQCLCKEGYFELSGNLECQKCSPFCHKCDSQKCLQCLPNLNRGINFKGQCECLEGYYSLKNENTCFKCSSQCKSCIQSESQCTSCNSDLRVLSQNQVCLCKEGYFEDPLSGKCLKCQNGCSSCQNMTVCTKCNTNFSLDSKGICQKVIPSTVSKEQLKTVSSATEQATTVVIGSTITSSFLLQSVQPNASIASSFLKLQKLYFMLLIKTTYPELLYTFFKAFNGKSPIDQINKFNLLTKYIFGEDKGVILPNKFGLEKIGENILYNCGGSICIIIFFWVISLAFLIYYKKQQKKQQMVEIKDKFLKFVCFFNESLFPLLFVLIHQILITIVFFTTGIQFYSVAIYDAYELDLILVKMIVTVIALVYFLIFLFKMCKLVNNQNNYQAENIYFNQKSIEILVYEQFNQETKSLPKLARNFQLIFILFENALFPLLITFAESSFTPQIFSCLAVQISLFCISLLLRPLKTCTQNFFLIIEQALWVIVLLGIYFVGKRVSNLENLQVVPESDIQLLTKLSWIIMGSCLLILILNPISMFIDIFAKRKLLKEKISQIFVNIKDKFCKQQKKKEITENDHSDNSLSINSKNLSYNLINQKKIKKYNSQKKQDPYGINIFNFKKSQISECHLWNNQFMQKQNSIRLNLTQKQSSKHKLENQIELFSIK
ncbi:hypothetical protein ABPG72_014763 [Tetrahymena utriculariae]